MCTYVCSYCLYTNLQLAILLLCRLKAVRCTDRRVRAMTDILSGIKVLKMYAWENVFKKLIFNIRRSVRKERLDNVYICPYFV